MKTRKRNATGRRLWRIAGLAVLFSLAVALALPSAASAEEVCPFGEVDCTYPGDCSRYVDVNNDGICDLSQTGETAALADGDSTSATQPSAPLTEAKSESGGGGRRRGSGLLASSDSADPPTTGSGTLAGGVVTDTDSGGNPLLTRYYVSPIAIAFFLVYAISFFLYKTKRIKITTHRRIWNVLLLSTFLITGIFGLILTIQLDYRLTFQMPVNLLFWHVEAGIVMTLISIFHMAWHFKYYARIFRTSRAKTREVEAAGRYAPPRTAVPQGQVTYYATEGVRTAESAQSLGNRWDS